jgi:hypothetical protein
MKRKTYTEDFKAHAVERLVNSGKPISQIDRELGARIRPCGTRRKSSLLKFNWSGCSQCCSKSLPRSQTDFSMTALSGDDDEPTKAQGACSPGENLQSRELPTREALSTMQKVKYIQIAAPGRHSAAQSRTCCFGRNRDKNLRCSTLLPIAH